MKGKGLERFAFYLVVGEGKELPNGEGDASGYVVNEDGRVFFFWIGWDDERNTEILEIWREEEPGPDWLEHEPYRQAREAVGLLDP